MAPQPPDEFDLIATYFAPLAASAPGAHGLGDDAASFQPSPGMELVLTVDAIVEGVHFLPVDPADDIARKLLRVNLSDLAAKGARPLGYLLTTAWTPATPVEWIAAFARGLGADQKLFDVALWGGDTVSTPGPMSFSLTAIGEVPSGQMLRRSGGRPGDDLYVTGTLGDAALGLAVAQGQLSTSEADATYLIGRYRRPEPRVAFGRGLVGVAHASLDVSDGLMADLTHLCVQSGLGARVEAVALPLSEAAAACLSSSAALIEKVMTGGDDYELLFSAPAQAAKAIDSLARQSNTQVTRIGALVDAKEGVVALNDKGQPMVFPKLGFRHR